MLICASCRSWQKFPISKELCRSLKGSSKNYQLWEMKPLKSLEKYWRGFNLPTINYDNYSSRKISCFTFWSEFVHLQVNLQPFVLVLFFLAVFCESGLHTMEGMKPNTEGNLQNSVQVSAR